MKLYTSIILHARFGEGVTLDMGPIDGLLMLHKNSKQKKTEIYKIDIEGSFYSNLSEAKGGMTLQPYPMAQSQRNKAIIEMTYDEKTKKITSLDKLFSLDAKKWQEEKIPSTELHKDALETMNTFYQINKSRSAQPPVPAMIN